MDASCIHPYHLELTKCLLDIRNNIFYIFNSHTETNQIRLNACFYQLFVIHLTMRMAGRMKNTASGICYMCHDRYHF